MMDNYHIYYHITYESNLKSILEYGLDSSMCSGHVLHLCDKRFLPYWKVLCDGDILLSVKIPSNKLPIKHMEYGYADYKYLGVVPPDCIDVVTAYNLEIPMEQLCEDLLYEVNELVDWLVFNNPVSSSIISRVERCVYILPRLNWSVLHSIGLLGILGDIASGSNHCFIDVDPDLKVKYYKRLTTVERKDNLDIYFRLEGVANYIDQILLQ